MTDRRRVRNTKRTVVDGITFDSKREAKRYAELQILVRAGEISDLERQYEITLLGRQDTLRTPTGRAMRYFADFRYYDKRAGAWVIEDAKGHPTDTYKMKKAVLAAMGLEIIEV